VGTAADKKAKRSKEANNVYQTLPPYGSN